MSLNRRGSLRSALFRITFSVFLEKQRQDSRRKLRQMYKGKKSSEPRWSNTVASHLETLWSLCSWRYSDLPGCPDLIPVLLWAELGTDVCQRCLRPETSAWSWEMRLLLVYYSIAINSGSRLMRAAASFFYPKSVFWFLVLKGFLCCILWSVFLLILQVAFWKAATDTEFTELVTWSGVQGDIMNCHLCVVAVTSVGLHLENMTRLRHRYIAAEVTRNIHFLADRRKTESSFTLFLNSHLPFSESPSRALPYSASCDVLLLFTSSDNPCSFISRSLGQAFLIYQ